MRKNLLYLFATAVLLFVTSCSNDDLLTEAEGDGEATVTFNVNALGSASTRTYSDGTTATVLHYGVYDSSTGYLSAISSEEVGTETMSDLQATVTLNLAKGNSYTIVFWAEAEESPYEVSFADTETDDSGNETSVSPTVTFKEGYDIVNNDENRDAFYAVVETGVVSSSYDETVTLTRPFAQLNVGTLSTDLEAYKATGNSVAYTKVVVTGVGNTLNLLTGDVTYDGSTSGGEVTFEWAAIPDADEESFPLNSSSSDDDDSSDSSSDDTSSDDTTAEAVTLSYDYLAMNYLLVGEDACTVDVEFYYSASSAEESGHVVEVSSVPVQRNYKTNLYGSLLTSEFTYNVSIDKDYKDKYNIETTATVSDATSLAQELKNGTDIIYVTDDITVSSSLLFYEDAVVDLQGNEVTLTTSSSWFGTYATDIEAIITNGTIKSSYYAVVAYTANSSITLENVDIDSSLYSVLIQAANSSVTMTECNVESDKYAIVVTSSGASLTLTDVEVESAYGIYVGASTDMEITDSEIVATDYSAIYLATGNSTLNVENTSLTADYHVLTIGASSMDSDGDEVTLTGCELNAEENSGGCGILIQGAPHTLTVTDCTIDSDYFGIYQNGSTAGSTITVDGSTITAPADGIYLSNAASYDYNVLTLTDSKVTSEENSAIEVKKTNLTVDNCTLVAETTESQRYFVSDSGASSAGYGIVLAGYVETTSYEGDVSLSNIAYNLSSTSVIDGTSKVINVNYFDANSTKIYTGDPGGAWTGGDVDYYHNDYNDYGSDGAVTTTTSE